MGNVLTYACHSMGCVAAKGAYKVMFKVNDCCVLGCNLTLGALPCIYAILKG